MSGKRAIGAVDTIWLHMDRPNNLMVIDSVMWFDKPADWDRLTNVIRRRVIERYPVFSQRPVESWNPVGLPSWEDDPDFRLERHIIRATLAGPDGRLGDQASLQRYVERQMHRPFSREHPLWEVHYIDGFGAGSAVMFRFHHALADGIALTRVLLSLTDQTARGDLREPARSTRGAAGPAAARRGGLVGVAETLGATAVNAGRGGFRLLSAARGAADLHRLPAALGLADGAVRSTGKVFLHRNPPSPLQGTPGVQKLAVWSEPRKVADIKRIAQQADATINDVLIAAVSGAINTYVTDRGGEPADLATMVPVNLRPLDQELPRELGNKFALVLLSLPTGVGAPLQRLAESKRRMDAIKHSPEAALTFGLISAIGRTGPDVERRLINFFSAKAIGVTTNVIGPQQRRYIAGTPIAGIIGWAPGSGSQTLNVAIFSYNRTIRVGFKADATVVPDVEKLVHAFDAEMNHLLAIARAR